MQTHLTDAILNTPQGQEAEAILRKCVHCGFCTATCPTYLLLGNELDSPRGRIYLMKQVLEGEQATERTQLHLDRCLTCRACETTCPSGVEYGKLLDIGRELVDREVSRKLFDRTMRTILQLVVPNTILLKVMMYFAWLSRPVLPASLRKKIPSKESAGRWPATTHERRVIIHQGCVQRVTKPEINAAAARYLDANSISAIRMNDTCCGALGLHLGNREFFERYARKNIDAWWPQIQSDVEAIVSTASGCGVTIKDYGDLLKRDPDYAHKARRVSELTVDISEVAVEEAAPAERKRFARVAFQSPCTLQHGQKNLNTVEKILNQHGVDTTHVANSHLCCGSAGVYSLMQREISQQLLNNKLTALKDGQPECIVTANIGCQMHLESKSEIPVKHWVQVVAPD